MTQFPLKKEDTTIEIFMGSEYDIHAETTDELKSYLQQIIEDLPKGEKIAEIHCQGTKIYYLLENGIPK